MKDLRAVDLFSVVADVRRYNAWRRGDESLEMPEPKRIGESLDVICDALEQTARERDDLREKYRIHHAEADRLTAVVRAAAVLIAAKGRHNTMLAYEGLRAAISPENDPTHARPKP